MTRVFGLGLDPLRIEEWARVWIGPSFDSISRLGERDVILEEGGWGGERVGCGRQP